MAKKDPRIDAYIERSAPFAKPILRHLRAVVHAGCPPVEETIKWSMPHFDYKGIMCGMAAFKKHCAFGFWKSKLVLAPEVRANNDSMGHFGCIRSLDDLPSKTVLIRYVKKAAALNESGTKVPGRDKPKKRPALKIPNYFSKALNRDTKAKKTFENFSPSHRREYIEWITGAKRDETRQKRLETAIQWLSEGKPLNWRYIK